MEKNTSKLKLDRILCKHSYSDAIEAISRLAAYTTSRSLKPLGHDEYYTLSEELFRKDLLLLAISIRRLSELTKSQSLLKGKHVEISYTEQSGKLVARKESCWNLLGNVVHGVEIEVFKDIGKIELFTNRIDIFAFMKTNEECDAVISIKSDKFHRKHLKMIDFLIHMNSYADEANDILSDNGIYIG